MSRRYRVNLHHMARNHILRKMLSHFRPNIRNLQWLIRSEIRHNMVFFPIILKQNDDVIHSAYVMKAIFDIPDFNSESADFHLIIDSAKIFYISIRQPLRKVTRPVYTLSSDIRNNEFFICQTCAVAIAFCKTTSGNT